MSQRTDGGQPVRVAPGADYGDRAAMVAQQKAAPMAATTSTPGGSPTAMPPSGGGGVGAVASPYTGGAFAAPSARAGEPVTHGVGVGPGGGTEALTGAPVRPQGPGPMTTLLMSMQGGGATGTLAALLQHAQMQNQ